MPDHQFMATSQAGHGWGSCTCAAAQAALADRLLQVVPVHPLDSSDHGRARSQERHTAAASTTCLQVETGTSHSITTSSAAPHKSSVQHLLEQCDLMFQV